MHLTHRPATLGDFDACYRACYYTSGYGDVPREIAYREWRILLTNPSTLSMVVEDEERPQGARLVGYAQSVFVSDAFVQWARSTMPPYVNTHATNKLPDGSWPLLSQAEIRAANSGGGLNALTTHWGWAEPPLTADEGPVVRDFIHDKFPFYARGYNYKEIMVEVSGDKNREMCEQMGLRLRRDYAEYYRTTPPPEPDLHPYLMSLTREEALGSEGSRMSRNFVYTPPRIFFDRRDQEVLQMALSGMQDEEIANALGVGQAAVAKRWLKLYDRVSQRLPNLLPATPGGKRGTEKRRLLLRYLQDHLEELRPTIRSG